MLKSLGTIPSTTKKKKKIRKQGWEIYDGDYSKPFILKKKSQYQSHMDTTITLRQTETSAVFPEMQS